MQGMKKQVWLAVFPVILIEIIQGDGVSKTWISKSEVLKLHLRKGMAETATVMVLLALIGNVAVLSVGIGGFKDVLGMGADGNAGDKIEEEFLAPVRTVCIQGTTADNRIQAFTLSSTINVTLVSEDNDALKDQSIRALLVDENAQLLNSEPIEDCVIEFDQTPSRYRVFEESEPYKLNITNEQERGGKPFTVISVEER